MGKKAGGSLKDEKDYFLCGRTISFFPLMMTFLATQVGGGLILGAAQEAWTYGWSVILYPLGATLGLFALALGLGKRLSRFSVGTIAALFEVVYGSVLLKKIASFLSIISLFLILIAQVIASRKFMGSLSIDSDLIFLAFWLIVILYTSYGGLKAVIATDVLQAAFFTCVFIGCFAYTFFTHSAVSLAAFTSPSPTLFEPSHAKFIGWLLMPLLFMVIEQDMGQRCLAAKSPRTISLATAVAALITCLLSLIPLFYGVVGKHLGITNNGSSSVLMDVVLATTTPAMTALMGCAVLAAIVSTADSLLNAISSNIAQDFLTPSSKGVKRAQILTLLISLAALAFSFAYEHVVSLLILSYELSVSALFVPLFFSLFLEKGSTRAATLSVLFGATSFTLLHFFPLPFPRELLSLAFSLLGFGLGLLIRAPALALKQ